MPHAGRPPKISTDLIAKIAKAIHRGNYRETASAINDIHRDTLNEWLRRGAREKERVKSLQAKGETRARVHAGEKLYVQLSDAVEKALAVADDRDLARVDAGARGGEKVVVEVTRTISKPVIHESGKPLVTKAGQPIVIVETITERRISRTGPDWHAAAWKLERRNPRLYGRRTYQEVTGRDGQDLIPLTAIRAALAATDEVEDAEWEELEEHANDAYNEANAARLLGSGDGPADLEG